MSVTMRARPLDRFRRRAAYFPAPALCAVWLAACGEPAPAHRVTEVDAGPGDAGEVGDSSLFIRATRSEGMEGAWRALVSTDGRPVADLALGACDDGADASTARCASLEGLAPGLHAVTVFLDRDGNGALDGCPFPPQLGDTRHPDTFENLVGQTQVLVIIGEESTAEVPVDRRICGPGEAETGLAGRLVGPDETLGTRPLFLRLEPSSACSDAEPGAEPPVTIALEGAVIDGALDFSIGELLPGCFDLTFFVDADGDGEPTPCDAWPAGGDRAVAHRGGVAIVAGERRALAADVPLAPSAECPKLLTGLSGRLALAPALVESVTAGLLPAAALEAEPRIHLTALGTGKVLDWPLALSRIPVDVPAPFVIAALEPGNYDVAVYLDGDRDGTFGPCGGLAGGVDAILEQRRSVQVADEVLTDLGELRLTRSPECTTLDVEVRLRPQIPVEPGPVGSGRPVRLELLPLDAEGERRSVLVFENHGTLDDRPSNEMGEIRLAAQIRPGAYDARLFVDTDRNGVYGDCRQDPFFDRISGPVMRVDVAPGAPLDLGDAALTVSDCPVPEVSITPEFRLAEGIAAPPGLQLRFEISEAGGWMEAYPRRMDVPASALPAAHPKIALAPGTFTLRAWLERSVAPIFDPCEAPTPDPFTGVATFTLDARTLTARPEVVLDRACLAESR
jgi:uncharacterized protein (DUF2141 family)